MPPIAYLEEASVVDFCGHKRLRGLVFGHPNFEDGTDILTSKIVGISKDATTAYTNDDFIYRVRSYKGDMDYLLDQVESQYRHGGLLNA